MSRGSAAVRGKDRLTVKRIAAWLKSGKPPIKLRDGAGLFLKRLPSGTATWQLQYRHAMNERTFSIGPVSAVSLKQAREERDRVKQIIKTGRDPVQARLTARAGEISSSGELFEDLLKAWLKKQQQAWSEIHFDKASKALERHVVPALGKLPVRDITPKMVSNVIEKIQRGGRRETASKILQHVRAVFRYAASDGLRNDNPAEPAIEVLNKAKRVKHRPALLTFASLGEVLRAGELPIISPEVRLALRIIAFTAVRISNAVEAEWEEFDLNVEPAMWIIPRAKMKMRDREHDHKVVLPAQLAEDLRLWHDSSGAPASGYVVPGKQGRSYISREAVEKALRTMGFANKQTPHGWRASFSTLAKDNGFDKQVVDLALDHIHDNEIARAYDRGERLTKRIELAKWWGDQLDAAQHGAEVIKLQAGKRSHSDGS